MDKYFYSIEEGDNEKIIHLSGNVYFNDSGATEKDYRLAEWTFLYLTIEEAKELISNNTFFEYVNEKIAYLEDITEEEAKIISRTYHNGSSGTELHIADITKATPCGNYYF